MFVSRFITISVICSLCLATITPAWCVNIKTFFETICISALLSNSVVKADITPDNKFEESSKNTDQNWCSCFDNYIFDYYYHEYSNMGVVYRPNKSVTRCSEDTIVDDLFYCAENNHPDAQFVLAKFSEDGKVNYTDSDDASFVGIDQEQALFWYLSSFYTLWDLEQKLDEKKEYPNPVRRCFILKLYKHLINYDSMMNDCYRYKSFPNAFTFNFDDPTKLNITICPTEEACTRLVEKDIYKWFVHMHRLYMPTCVFEERRETIENRRKKLAFQKNRKVES